MQDVACPSAIWDIENECMSIDERKALQLQRLQTQVARLYDRVPFYRERLDSAGVSPDQIRSLDDVRRLPFTTKADLRDHYPYGMLAVPLEECARLHCSTGTTGKPTVVAYTKKDMEIWSDLVARFATAAGVHKHDLVQIAFGYGLFTGGFGLHYGMERIGACVLPVSGGNTDRQVQLLHDLRASVLVCTPSYSLHIAEVMKHAGLSPKDLNLRVGLFGSEPWTEEMRTEIEARLGISATDNYGLSEIIGPGVAGECGEKKGMHFQEDHFLVEHINPQTGEEAKPGELGELVITALTREAFAAIRYRTRDLCYLMDEPCPCGRTTRRMTKLVGRSDDMLIIRGVNVYPSQVEQVLLKMSGVEPHYLLTVARAGAMDHLEIKVEMQAALFSDEMKRLHKIEKELEHRLHSALGVSFKLTLVEPGTLERGAGKAKRVLDLRKKE
ncbi:TPA: phenylacetate--CoA ligase [Candidatus Sumerlaeota bacterium]|jgi:phenylacetate-CoA ligase|nr:phenylacetate--CoA ligase [Candidatus Sumerlaeota bacterium]